MAPSAKPAGIDQGFIDRAEELGIKDLLVAFAETLNSTRSTAANKVRASEPGYLVTTLMTASCNCDAAVSMMSSMSSSYPPRPHDDTCAWARFMVLFGTPAAQKEFNVPADMFRRWAQRVSERPDGETYRDVQMARRFLEKDKGVGR